MDDADSQAAKIKHIDAIGSLSIMNTRIRTVKTVVEERERGRVGEEDCESEVGGEVDGVSL